MTDDTGLDLVTGAFSYTGRVIARRLLDAGRQARTLTGHPDRPDPFGGRVEAMPYTFDQPERLVQAMAGVTTFYNTYWVRFERGGATYSQAVRNSRALFDAAREAGVRRIVHISIAKADAAPELPYYEGKAQVEQELAAAGVPHSVIRPTVVYGDGDVLLNNLAWLLRRFPVFGVPGSGEYRIRPVHVDDVAALCVAAADRSSNDVTDAVGPEVFTFNDWVRAVRDAVGARSWLVHLPPYLVTPLAGIIGRLHGDVLLTRQEVTGLLADLTTTDGPATGQTVFSDWIGEHASELGRQWSSEVGRHFDR